MDTIQSTPHRSTLADFAALVDAVIGHGGHRSRTTDADYVEGGPYYTSFRYYEPGEPDDDNIWMDENNQEADLHFTVDWQGLQLVLRDGTLPLTPTEPGWTYVEEWLVGPDNYVCLVRKTGNGDCFFAEAD